jgi:hypothetical protein
MKKIYITIVLLIIHLFILTIPQSCKKANTKVTKVAIDSLPIYGAMYTRLMCDSIRYWEVFGYFGPLSDTLGTHYYPNDDTAEVAFIDINTISFSFMNYGLQRMTLSSATSKRLLYYEAITEESHIFPNVLDTLQIFSAYYFPWNDSISITSVDQTVGWTNTTYITL